MKNPKTGGGFVNSQIGGAEQGLLSEDDKTWFSREMMLVPKEEGVPCCRQRPQGKNVYRGKKNQRKKRFSEERKNLQ